jgi:hypothetical protein
MKRRIRVACRTLSRRFPGLGPEGAEAAPAVSWAAPFRPGAGAALLAGTACAVAAMIAPVAEGDKRPLAMASTMAPALAPMAAMADARAEGGGRRLILPVQVVPEFTIENLSGSSSGPLPLVIGLPNELPGSYAFLLFRGLPQPFALSSGFRTKDHWVLSLRDASTVKLIPPSGYEGSFAVEVLFMRGQDVPAERRIFTVELTRPKPSEPPAVASLPPVPSDQLRATTAVERTAASPGPVARTAPPPPVAPAPQIGNPQPMTERDRSMLARADRLLREGDVAAARLLLAHLAQKGIAEGALAMARSYDPDVLVTLRVAGLEPDPARARDWYRRAEQLGSTQATARLSTLDTGGR